MDDTQGGRCLYNGRPADASGRAALRRLCAVATHPTEHEIPPSYHTYNMIKKIEPEESQGQALMQPRVKRMDVVVEYTGTAVCLRRSLLLWSITLRRGAMANGGIASVTPVMVTGTIGTPTRCAMVKGPRLNCPNRPSRLRVPSGCDTRVEMEARSNRDVEDQGIGKSNNVLRVRCGRQPREQRHGLGSARKTIDYKYQVQV